MVRSYRAILPCLIGLLAAVAAPPCAAQEPGFAPGFAELVEVSEVSLDVLATDAAGAAVPGLGIGDFEVLENGRPVQLTSVSFAANRYGSAGASGGAPSEIPASRYLIFFFHDQSALASSGVALLRQQLQAGRDAVRWVAEKMEPSDWAAVVGYDTRLRLHQDFTQDRDALTRAIERVAAGKKPEDFVPSRREARGRGLELKILSRIPSGGRSAKTAAGNVYEGLRQVAEAGGYLVGRKILLLYTTGFGVRRGPTSVPDPRYFPALEAELNDHNVAIYPLDLTPAGRPPFEEDFLGALADATGGAYDPNISGFLRPLEAIAGANTGYYLLTYRSERQAGEIGYQRVEVKVRDPGVRVLARRGYRYGL